MCLLLESRLIYLAPQQAAVNSVDLFHRKHFPLFRGSHVFLSRLEQIDEVIGAFKNDFNEPKMFARLCLVRHL